MRALSHLLLMREMRALRPVLFGRCYSGPLRRLGDDLPSAATELGDAPYEPGEQVEDSSPSNISHQKEEKLGRKGHLSSPGLVLTHPTLKLSYTTLLVVHTHTHTHICTYVCMHIHTHSTVPLGCPQSQAGEHKGDFQSQILPISIFAS